MNIIKTKEPKSKTAGLLSRDLSWVDFNERVLEEGLRKDLKPLDRLKYLSIVSSNFDEFFMVRVAAVKRARYNAGPAVTAPNEELETIGKRVRSIIERQYKTLNTEVLPDLAEGGLCIVRPKDWTKTQREFLEAAFMQEYLPVLTPLKADDEGPLPIIENYWIHAAFLLEPEDKTAEENISIIRIPPVLDRIVRIHPETVSDKKLSVAFLEDMIVEWGNYLFPGFRVRGQLLFSVNRDADFSVDEQRDEDFIEAMEEVLEDREKSMVVRMTYSQGSRKLLDYFASRFGITEDDLYEIDGPLNLGNLYDLAMIPGFDRLREKPWNIYRNPDFNDDQSIWDRIREGDVVLHLPYQNFDPVIRFFRDAASDPAVISIKTTLYRTSGNSPIVKALEQASMSGKHVTAVVELKARFDEKQNISWANRLEKAGVIVVYGLAHLKIHAKMSMIIRRENGKLRRYVHLSTGNYNEATAKVYEDLSIFTARDDIAYDTGLIFNMITGYSVIQTMRRLTIAPVALKERLLYLIDREINQSGQQSPGKIIAKMNSLADEQIIDALYHASCAGVEIMLIVRGICLLRPGVPGLSENIKVISIIDYYLEHSRIFYFANSGSEELYLSSADWMPRNMERRVELMFPVLNDDIKKFIMEILGSYLQDNTHAWDLDCEGRWSRVKQESDILYRAQTKFLSMAEKASAADIDAPADTADKEFIIRRSPL
ncbi:MAG: polyphosphate kinase 1 [Treponema sp.]|nr:polyphosphate kinase 1 [Treponema sp.]